MIAPGEIIETSKKETQVPGVEKVVRVLYQSKQWDGKLRACSGLIFLPKVKKTKPPSVAWAHGTIGMADKLAPSTQKDPGRKIPYLKEFMHQGYVVTATDYAGLGTEGIQNYLIGHDEAQDIINLIRAARKLEGADIANRFSVVGHSQGGHAALFVGQLTKELAPELDLKCVVAECPPTLLTELLERQKQSIVAWMIGPQLAMAWPKVYKNLRLSDLLTSAALNNYDRMALMRPEAAGLEGILRFKLGQKFFKGDPTLDKVLNQGLKDQTPKTSRNLPYLIVQGLLDRLVLPDIARRYVDLAKTEGAHIDYLEIPTGTHNSVVSLAATEVNRFIADHLN